jgi:hypothetical protein
MIYRYYMNAEMVQVAHAKAQEMGATKTSFNAGERVYVGFLGELVFLDYFGGVNNFSYNWDIEINDRKIDVKTKTVTSIPLPHYLCDVHAHQLKQNCDSYYFIRVNMETLIAYMLGGLLKKAFYAMAKFYKAGELVEGSAFKYNYDSWALPISQLKQP